MKLLSVRRVLSSPSSLAFSLITDIVQSRLTFDVRLLEDYIPDIIGGTLGHRFNMEGSEDGSYLSFAPNLASHLLISTNMLGELGARDYPVMVQAVVLTLESLLGSTWCASQVGEQSLRLEVDMTHVPEICETEIMLDCTLEPVRFPDCSSPLVSAGPPTRQSRAQARNLTELSTLDSYLDLREPTVVHAIRKLARGWMRSGGSLRKLGGGVTSSFNYQPLIDQPEVKSIKWSEFMSGVSAATLDVLAGYLVTSKSREVLLERVRVSAMELLLVTAPMMLGTAILLNGNPLAFQPGLNSSEIVSYIISEVTERIPLELPNYSYHLFKDDPSALSTDLRCIIDRKSLCMRLLESKPGARAARILKQISKAPIFAGMSSDQSADWYISAMTSAPFLCDTVTRSDDSAVSTLRRLRGRIVQSGQSELDWSVPELPDGIIHCSNCIGTDRVLIGPIDPLPFRPGPEVTERSWADRRIITLGSSVYRWLPLMTILNEQSFIVVIGLGQMGIAHCIPQGSSIIGIDLRSSLAEKGHAFCDDKIQLGNGLKYSISPISWTSTGDILEDDVFDCARKISMFADALIIDIEGVNTRTRWSLRNRLSKVLSCYVFVRLYDADDVIDELERSVCAHSTFTTRMWRSSSNNQNELIVGDKERELPVYTAVGDHISTDWSWSNDLEDANASLVRRSTKIAEIELEKIGKWKNTRRARRLKLLVD